MKRFRSLLILSIVLGAATGASGALGGAFEQHEVRINRPGQSGGGAYGTLWVARESDDPTQFIGCTAFATTWCEAKDAAGNRKVCNSNSDYVRDMARAIQPTSHVGFHVRISDGDCVTVSVDNSSIHLPGPTNYMQPIGGVYLP